ncbi:restriction endonuclease subunit S [Pseudomonas sp. AA-38]|uniref:restriction endonuclease subunit S n=1 Tax=Pseudomonas sp. AA-38 TaxID=3028807 RepID=UPI0023F7C376|nr:restriction endonuclease subunit S [Pseudomonas sp. AA-38]
MSKPIQSPFPRYQLAELAALGTDTFVDGPFGSGLKSHEYVDAGVRLIQLQNIGEGKWHDENKKFITPRKFKTLERHGAVPGDIAIAKMADPVARACLVPPVSKQFVVVADCIRLRLDQSRFDPGFVVRSINSPYTRREAEKKAIGSTRVRINLSVLKTVGCLAPELIEQQAITRILDTLDTAICETEALINKLKAVKQGLLQDLLTRGIDTNGQLRPPQSEAPQLYKESLLGWIPRGWELRELGKLAEVSRGKFTHRPRNDPAFFDGEYPFIQTGDVALAQGGYISSYSQTLSERGITVSQEFPAGTIAITIAANIADTAILARPMFFPDSVVGAVVAPEHNIRFVELSIRRAKRTLDARAPQSAQKNINLQDLRPLLLAVPDRIEQDAIAERYNAIQARLEAEQIAVNKLCQKKLSLMDDLLTGRVRVTPLLESMLQTTAPTGA